MSSHNNYTVIQELTVTGRGLILSINTKESTTTPVPGNHLTFRGKAYTITGIETSLSFMHPPVRDHKLGILVKEIDRNELNSDHHVFYSDYVAKIAKTYDI